MTTLSDAETQDWWSSLCHAVRRKLEMPGAAPLPTAADVADALLETFMAEARGECLQRLNALQSGKFLRGTLHKDGSIEMQPTLYLSMLCAGITHFGGHDVRPLWKQHWHAIFTSAHKAFCEAQDAGVDLKHPVAPLIEGWLREQQRKAETPERARVLTAGRGNIARIPNSAKTAALATWEQRDEVMIVEVDGEPFATSLQYIPRRAQGQKDGAALLPLPGTGTAPDLRLWLLQKIEESAGIDRRNPLPADTLYLLALGSALLSSIRLHVDQLGAFMAGRFDTAGIGTRQKDRWRARAWAAGHWARLLIKTPAGHYLPLLPIDVGGDLPEGWLRIWPYQWKQNGKGYRQTGVLTMQATRADKRGSFPRLAAGIEDYLAGAGSIGRDRRSRLLISERKGGPGLVSDFIPYPVLLARAGFYFELNDKKSYNATAALWHSLAAELERRGYLLPSLRSEAAAGDTFEIVEIVKGNRGGPGGVRVRASARLIEAQAQAAKRRGNRGLDAIPLRDLFKE